MLHNEIVEFMKARGAALMSRISVPRMEKVFLRCYLCGWKEVLPWPRRQESESIIQQHKIDCPHTT